MIYLYRRVEVHDDKVIVPLERDFQKYYLALLPKVDPRITTRHPPHITIIRSFEIFNKSKIENFHNRQILFHYDPFIREDENRYFLNCWCDELCVMRKFAGLEIYRPGYTCFHITIGKKNATSLAK